MSIPLNVELLVVVADALIPNPDATVPPGLGVFSETFISWLKWALGAAGVAGVLFCGLMVILGRRNRNQMATEGVMGAVWVVGGVVLGSSAALLVAVFL